MPRDTDRLTLAVAKGRIFKEALPLLAAVGIVPTEDPEKSRKLILPTSDPAIEMVIVRATDVPTYVDYGGADLGIVGRDTLLEYEAGGFYEPLDLRISPCRLSVAGATPELLERTRLRVATKYPVITRRHFAAKGVQTEIIKLYGSMELAPLVGLADCIVDLVDTGNTLRANGLLELEEICKVSSRLIVNKASLKTRYALATRLLGKLEALLASTAGRP
ncbi:MAG: ATP phosphoribosyltransferase [Gammaproteobacteria bacterium]|nr:ATP phosphoribosyltransferase [Gammaproteobacteria bacterium]